MAAALTNLGDFCPILHKCKNTINISNLLILICNKFNSYFLYTLAQQSPFTTYLHSMQIVQLQLNHILKKYKRI